MVSKRASKWEELMFYVVDSKLSFKPSPPELCVCSGSNEKEKQASCKTNNTLVGVKWFHFHKEKSCAVMKSLFLCWHDSWDVGYVTPDAHQHERVETEAWEDRGRSLKWYFLFKLTFVLQSPVLATSCKLFSKVVCPAWYSQNSLW